ncbi:MAG: ABC transporter substrate-binding protein [Ardenticatenaceae bacterium]|nr:ABC transporter substrate-binding protein [Ardenticatenaceae bacterium]HBY92341.1 hypothetical protein [Chloroflexota bacterium]
MNRQGRFAVRSAVLTLLMILVLIVSACGQAATPQAVPSQPTEASAQPTQASAQPTEAAAGDLTTVTMAYVPIVALGPLYLADELGYFAKRGIKNEYTTNANPYDLLGVQSQGKLDANIVGTSAAFFNAINSGLKVRAVSDRMQYRCSSDNMLIVRSSLYDEGVKTPADLKGKKIAIIARGSGTEYWLSLILSKENMKLSDVEIVTLSYPDTVNALKTGAIDAGFVAEPLTVQAIRDGTAKRIIAMHQVLPGQQLGEMIFSQEFTARDGGKWAQAWLAAWLEGVRYYLDPANKERVIQTVSKWTRVDEGIIRELYGTDQWPWMNPNGDLDTEYIAANDGKWMLENKLIEKLPPASEYYNDGPLKAAQNELGRVEVKRDCASVPPLQ